VIEWAELIAPLLAEGGIMVDIEKDPLKGENVRIIKIG